MIEVSGAFDDVGDAVTVAITPGGQGRMGRHPQRAIQQQHDRNERQ